MLGIQRERPVERLDHFVLRHFVLAHVEKVCGHRQIVTRRHKCFSTTSALKRRNDCRNLGQQPNAFFNRRLRIVSSGELVLHSKIADRRPQRVHRMPRRRKLLDDFHQPRTQAARSAFLFGEFGDLIRIGQLTIKQQESDLFKLTLFSKFVNGIAAIIKRLLLGQHMRHGRRVEDNSL